MTVAIGAPTVWNPLTQQFREPDTTFLLDPDVDSALGYGINSGNAAKGALLYGKDANAPNIVAGKFRKGIQPTVGASGYVWCPIEGVLGTGEFTLEFWLQTTVDWSTLTGNAWHFGEDQINNYVEFKIDNGGGSHPRLTVTAIHNQTSNLSYTFQAQSADFALGAYPASTWVSVAATLKGGVLTLYAGKTGDLQITQVAQNSGFVSPQVWAARGLGDGMMIPGVTGTARTGWTVSDLRVSRFARTPGQAVTNSDLSMIAVSATTGGTVQPLNGLVKLITGADQTHLPLSAAAATVKAQGGIGCHRVDTFLNTTPIVAGAPDAAHPSAGQSGSYSYDWTPVDREMKVVSEDMGCEPYVSVNSTPSILGGTAAPFSNTPFTLTSTAQAPDTLGTVTFTAATSGVTTTGEFTAPVGGGTNRYAYTGKTGVTLTGVTLISGTPGASIAANATVQVGLLGTGAAGHYPYDKSGTNPGPANNATEFGKTSADLANHLRSETNGITGLALTHKPIYFGLWNEPDQGANEWSTTNTIPDYLTQYGAFASALKTLDATIKVGGPEVSGWENLSTWHQAIIFYCGKLQAAPTAVSASAVAGGYSGTRTFNGAQQWFYKIVARNGVGNSVASTEVSATPATGGSVNLAWTRPTGAEAVDIYAASSAGGENGATQLLASGVRGTSFTDTGAALTAGSVPAAVVTNTTALDFISFHWYSGDLCDLVNAKQQIAAWCTSSGIAMPSLIVGEWDWTQANTGTSIGTGSYPFCQPGGGNNNNNIPPQAGTLSSQINAGVTVTSLPLNSLGIPVAPGTLLTVSHQVFTATGAVTTTASPVSVPVQSAVAAATYTSGRGVSIQPYTVDFVQNDWHAAFAAAAWCVMQNVGSYIRMTRFAGFDGSMFDASSVPQVMYNVSRMWGMTVGNTVLTTSTPSTAHPGLFWVASKDGSNKVYLFVVNLNYRKTRLNLIDGARPLGHPLTIDATASGKADGTTVTTYMLDDTLSNAFDTAGASTTLQTVATATLKSGKTQIRLRPRSVALVVIG